MFKLTSYCRVWADAEIWMVDLTTLQSHSEISAYCQPDIMMVSDLLIAHQARVSGWAGAMVKSEWRAILMSSLSRRPRGHILLALSGPRPRHNLHAMFSDI